MSNELLNGKNIKYVTVKEFQEIIDRRLGLFQMRGDMKDVKGYSGSGDGFDYVVSNDPANP